MRITGPGSSSRVSASRRDSQGVKGGSSFKVSGGETARPQSASGVQSLTAVDALIALQEVPDATEQRRRAVQRGEQILDLLEEIKIGLLSEGLSRSRLNRLVRMMQEKPATPQAEGLTDVLDEIELRARVELAKLEWAA